MNVRVYEPMRDLVAGSIVNAGAVCLADLSDPSAWPRWRDLTTPVTYDFARLGADPGATSIVTQALVSTIRSHYDEARAIVGVAHSGLYWAALTAHATGLPYEAVKLGATEHENPHDPMDVVPPGTPVLLVDDYVASGATLERAAKLIAGGGQRRVIGALSIMSMGRREADEVAHRLGIPIQALVGTSALLEAMAGAGLLSEAAAAEIQRFLRAPVDHRWVESELS